MMLKIKRALISVSDKSGLEDLVKTLNGFGVELLSTGGTAKIIKNLGIPVKDVSDYTGFPEMMGGRVKTLHPKIHGGLLALRTNKEHMEEAEKHNIQMIDMVVVNLYPFEKTVSKKGVELEEAIENIDIGGPSMLRSAAKNYESVAVVTSSSQYKELIEELKVNDGALSKTTLKRLATNVFKRTSEYDGAIYRYLLENAGGTSSASTLPDILNLSYEKVQDLRYGENPHQKGAFYRDLLSEYDGLCGIKQLHGKELSFNNIMDLNAALGIVKEFNKPAACIIKHTNPCGVAISTSLSKAYLDALDCDRLSAFGSIVGFNGNVDMELAETIMKEADFVECIIAPSFDKEAVKIFAKKKNIRLLEMPELKQKYIGLERDYKKVAGGLLVQDADMKVIEEKDLELVTKMRPSKEEVESLLFAWKVVKHVKSNAIVLCNGTKTVGIGAGQMSRVDSVIIACRKAGTRTKGSVLASDAFFPKKDSIEEAHKSGIKAIIQPGGSIKDKEVIEACDQFNIPMVLTKGRCFKH
jgi:phosphoribosylaminoimidazolecarboxamide formyltransferase / IMP cyclohydrolase